MDIMTIISNAAGELIAPTTAAYVLAAIGLNIHFGMTGLMNMGQAGFMLLGAYGFAITQSMGCNLFASVCAALALAVIYALLLGIPTLKLGPDYLAMVTLAAAEIIRIIGRSTAMTNFTGGSAGISPQDFTEKFESLSPLPDGSTTFLLWTYSNNIANSWWLRIVAWVLVVIAALLCWRWFHSPWGRMLKGIREDENAIRSLGKPVTRYKMESLILGGLFGAIAGIIFVLPRSVQPDSLGRTVTFYVWTILLLGGAVSVMPMIYMISTSLKPNGALYEFPPKFFPALDTVTIENYVYIFSQEKFYVNFLNSAIVAILTVVIAAFVSSALAFCLARFRFPGRRALFALVIGTMIIPGTTLIITQYQLASFFKLTNKLLGLVPFYVAWVIPFSTFMIKGYIESIPREFDEAVYMDGGSVFTVFFKVICPLASPAIASVSIFNFLTAWEEFPWALTVLNDTQKRTLPIAISGFFGQHQFTQWGYVFAMSVASLLPVLIIFICCQKYFVSGLQTGGIKG